MAIATSAQPAPLTDPNQQRQFVDPKTGNLTTNGQQVLQRIVNYVTGSCRVIPCNASGTNFITLAMLNNSPLISGYNDFDSFRFVAAATTTGTVTAAVQTPQGTLTTLNVYKTNGSAQAGAGDITVNLLYEFIYVDSLNSGAGGFVMR